VHWHGAFVGVLHGFLQESWSRICLDELQAGGS